GPRGLRPPPPSDVEKRGTLSRLRSADPTTYHPYRSHNSNVRIIRRRSRAWRTIHGFRKKARRETLASTARQSRPCSSSVTELMNESCQVRTRSIISESSGSMQGEARKLRSYASIAGGPPLPRRAHPHS